jgi:hypothetical protein
MWSSLTLFSGKITDLYRLFFQTFYNTLLEFASYPLHAVGERIAPDTQTISHCLAPINPIAPIILIIFHNQNPAFWRYLMQTSFKTTQLSFLLLLLVTSVDCRPIRMILLKWDVFMLVRLYSLQKNKSCDFITVTVNVFDLHSFNEPASDTVKNFIRTFFRKEYASPFKKPTQRAPQIFILFTREVVVSIEAVKQFAQ